MIMLDGMRADVVENGSLVKGKKGNSWSISASYMF